MMRMRMQAIGAAGAAAALAGCMASGETRQAAQPTDCADLAALGLDGVRIDVAEEIRPDPVWPFPAQGAGGPPPGGGGGVSTPFCRVAGVAEPEIGFEVWLPENWNGRIHNAGNGGYAGSFSYGAAAQALARGYAAGTTDTGHKATGGFDATWAVGHPERVEAFGHLAHHQLAVISKALVKARYGRPEDYAYYASCSTGGREGLAEAQLYPDDYDGIVAGAPANNLVRLETSALWLADRYPSGSPLEPPLLQLVARAAVAQCDVEDGVTDGIISDPEACGFDPASLACEAGDAPDTCLTPAQVETARLMHGPRSTDAGLALYPGRTYGTTFAGEVGAPSGVERSLIARMDSDYDWSVDSFDFDRDVPPLEAEFAKLINTDPDLSAFAEGGGKLILWHGWNDPLIIPYNTIAYYESVQAEMGDAAVEDFARLFMLPGVSHCAGGPGPDSHDALALIEAWVEQGEAPDRLLASKRGADGQPTMTRPVCAYPQVAAYDGEGDPNAADSFTCRAP